LGDRWTLLILRDLAFKNRRYFQDFLGASERISSNILADRLRRLERWKLIERNADPADGRRIRYFLTDDGVVRAFIPDPNPSGGTSFPEGISVAEEGTIWGASVGNRTAPKWMRD
jgi:hypothetical protein